MQFVKEQHRWLFIILIIMTVLLAAIIRLDNLTRRTMTHIEIYTPGIQLPNELSNPQSRLTIKQTLISLINAEEPHPPGYYLLMLGWTKVFGSSVLALRLPSVLLGVASIVLVYILGVLETKKITALLAAGMLAFNGYHIFWSQLAKMYILASLLGLLSTISLIIAAREEKRVKQLLYQVLYLGTTILGLATTHYFWFLLVTQIFWVLLRNRKRPAVPGLLSVQFAILVLGSPLLSLAIFQSRRPSYFDANFLRILGQYLQFGNLFEPSKTWDLLNISGGILLTITGLLILGVGLAFGEKLDDWDNKKAATGFWPAIVALSCPPAILFIVAFGFFAQGWNAKYAMLAVASSVIPLLLTIGYFALSRIWRYVCNIFILLENKFPFRSLNKLSSLLAILPIIMLILISPIVNMLTMRGLILFIPYLLLAMAGGFVFIAQKTRYWVVLAVLLVFVHALSIPYYKYNYQAEHPTDYKSLAEQWIPVIDDTDLIFVQKHWVTTPIYYYLNGERYNFIGSDYPEATKKYPESRIWVLSFEGLPASPEMVKALQDYDMNETIEALRIQSRLYVKSKSGE